MRTSAHVYTRWDVVPALKVIVDTIYICHNTSEGKKVNWRTCNLWLPGVRPSGIKKVNQWSSNVRASKQSYVDIVCK